MMFFTSNTLLYILSTLCFLHGVIAIPFSYRSLGPSDNLLKPKERPLEHIALLQQPYHKSVNLAYKTSTGGITTLYERQYQPYIRWDPEAEEELDKLGIRGKTRGEMKKWHESNVKIFFKQHPEIKNVQVAWIRHIAHEGGSDPKEKNHITASFEVANKVFLPNTYNGGKRHHIYVDKDNKGLGPENRKSLKKNNDNIHKADRKRMARQAQKKEKNKLLSHVKRNQSN